MAEAGVCENAPEHGSGMSGTVVLGVILAVIASSSSNLGLNIQKFSFNLEALKPKKDQQPYIKQWKWWAGLSLVILGASGDFICFALAPQSIVTPIGSFALVTNVFFAHLWLGEELSSRDLRGTGLILAGATLAVAFGDHEESCYTLDQLIELYARKAVVVYLIVVAVMLVGMYLIIRRCDQILNSRKEGDPLPAEYTWWAKLHPLSYAGLAGTFGANTCLFAKSTAEVLKTTIAGSNQMVYLFTYVILICMFTCIFFEQHWLATGLKYFDALYVVPVFQSFFIGVSVIGGGVYFDELGDFTTAQWIFFPMGVMICLTGVLVLSSRKMGEAKDIGKDVGLASADGTAPAHSDAGSSLGGTATTPTQRERSATALSLLPEFLGGAEIIEHERTSSTESANSGRRVSFLRPSVMNASGDDYSTVDTHDSTTGRRRMTITAFGIGGSIVADALPFMEPDAAEEDATQVPTTDTGIDVLGLGRVVAPTMETIPDEDTGDLESPVAPSDDAVADAEAADLSDVVVDTETKRSPEDGERGGDSVQGGDGEQGGEMASDMEAGAATATASTQ